MFYAKTKKSLSPKTTYSVSLLGKVNISKNVVMVRKMV